MKTYVITALAVFGVVWSLPADLLQTLDGRTLSGRIELRSGPDLHISGPSGNHQIPVSNIKNAWFGETSTTHSGLRKLNYKMYRGTWLTMPDFTKLKPSASGRLVDNFITIQPKITKDKIYTSRASFKLISVFLILIDWHRWINLFSPFIYSAS